MYNNGKNMAVSVTKNGAGCYCIIKNKAVLAFFYCGLQSVKSFHTAH